MSDAREVTDRLRILQFWWTTELFSPQPVPKPMPRATRPEDHQTVAWEPGDELPWERLGPPRPIHGSPRTWRHTVYVGVYSVEATYGFLQTAFGADGEAYDERPTGDSACAGMVVDQAGLLAVDSAVLSSALWAVGRIRHPGPRHPAWSDGFQDAAEAFVHSLDRWESARRERAGADEPVPLDSEALLGLLEVAHRAAGVDGIPGVATTRIVIDSQAVPLRRDDESPETDFLNSFYLDDLEVVRKRVSRGDLGRALIDYLTADPQLQTGRRRDVVRDPAVVDAGVTVERVPPGRWPEAPEKTLALSQQFAVNQALNDLAPASGLMGVNGPPGTGKTTMLRDVLAGNVVERARRLAALSTVDAAFTPDTHRWTARDGYPRKVRQLRPELTGFEMVVASANNAAVENVTTEIPAQKAIGDRWRGTADYFGDLATEVLRAGAKDQPGDAEPLVAWGLVAARLGNKKNRNDFRSAFWFDKKDARTKEPMAGRCPAMQTRLQQWKDGSAPHVPWGEARRLFRAAEERVTKLVADRRRAQDRQRRLQPLQEQDLQSGERVGALRNAVVDAERAWADSHAEVSQAIADRDRVQLEHDRHVEGRPGFWENLCSWWRVGKVWSGEHTRRQAQLRAAVDLHDLAVERCDLARTSAERARAELSVAEQKWTEVRGQLDVLTTQVHHDELRYGDGYPGPRWSGRARELRAPWLDTELDSARSDLFLAALRLHEHFLAAAAADMLDGLRAAVDVVAGAAPHKLESHKRLAAWQLFFLVVPLISTTFASMGRMMTGLEREALGWLFIDEAGQACPQYAVGSIWRARRVVVVGDPLQLQPVVTIPTKAQRDIAGFFGVSDTWLPPRASVQTLADRVAIVGTVLHQGDAPVWVSAPLRVHRRCDEPMFSVSNAIAYEDIMVNGVHREPDGFTDADRDRGISASFWADEPADRPGTHLQPRQIERLRGALAYLQARGVPFKDVIVISPFRQVAQRLAAVAEEYPGLRAGTIHTAQGREASVVILVLGGDPAKPGAQAWAASSPNLVNVAVSRAKRRLYVIGDLATWRQRPYFRELAAALRTARETSL